MYLSDLVYGLQDDLVKCWNSAHDPVSMLSRSVRRRHVAISVHRQVELAHPLDYDHAPGHQRRNAYTWTELKFQNRRRRGRTEFSFHGSHVVQQVGSAYISSKQDQGHKQCRWYIPWPAAGTGFALGADAGAPDLSNNMSRNSQIPYQKQISRN